jgi:acyl-CoA dehydrogenase
MPLDPETFSQFLDTLDRFVRERLLPHEEKVADDDAIPQFLIQEIRDMGLFGMSIPEEYGGLGLTMSEEVQAAFILGQSSPAFRSLIGTNNGIGSQGIIIDGTSEQKEKYLPKLASGEMIASFALTEPDAGSDAGSVRMSARRDGDKFVLNGTKRFITNAPHASLFTVFARTDPKTVNASGVTAFLVEAPTLGLSLGRMDKKMGQKGSHTCDVIFDDVCVPTSAILGGPERENSGFKTAMKVLDRGRLHIASSLGNLSLRSNSCRQCSPTAKQKLMPPAA